MFRFLTDNKMRPLWIMAAFALLFALFASGPQAAQAQGTVWTAWYWDNADLAGDPVVERLESQPSINVGFGSPADGIPTDDFSARWVNTIQVDEAASFTFSATVDDGLRVYINDELIIDDWEAQAEHTVSETVQLPAGSHVVRVEYFDSRDTARLDFNWGPAGADVSGDDVDDAGADVGAEDADFAANVVTATTTVNLRIRSGPTLTDEILDVLPAGTVVGFTGFMDESGQWVLVDAATGPTGWVSAQFLSNVPDDLSVPGEAQSEETQTEEDDMASEEVDEFPADVVTATTTVNLRIRSGPSLNDEILDTLPAGTVVGFTGFMDPTGQWVMVDAQDGPTGWVSAQFLSNIPDDLSVYAGDS